MHRLALGSVVLGTALSLLLAGGCGKSDGDDQAPGMAGSATAGGSASDAGTTGKAGNGATAGSASGGGAAGGNASGGNSAAGVASGGATTGGQDAQAGADSEGGSASRLLDCDPAKVLCKRVAPECGAGEVPSVQGSCYGDCVKIAQCACSTAEQCPQPNEYTCWSKQHCGPFVR